MNVYFPIKKGIRLTINKNSLWQIIFINEHFPRFFFFLLNFGIA